MSRRKSFITISLDLEGSSYQIDTRRKDRRFKPYSGKPDDLFNMKLDLTRKEYSRLKQIIQIHEKDVVY